MMIGDLLVILERLTVTINNPQSSIYNQSIITNHKSPMLYRIFIILARLPRYR